MKRYFIFLIITLLVSCDLISTREAEQPNTQGSDFIPATTPDILFLNLISSFKEKVPENYLASFVDPLYLEKEYKFIPSAGSISQFPILDTWNIEAERQYFIKLKGDSKDLPIILELKNEASQKFSDNAIYEYDYTLTVNLKNVEEAQVFEGSLQFRIFQDSRDQWVITEWQDIKKESQKSWSELKGSFY